MAWNLGDYVDVPHRLKLLAEKFPDVRIVEAAPVIREIGGKTFLEVMVTAWRTPDDQHPAVAYCWEPFPGTTPYTTDSEQMNAATSALGRLCAIMLPGAFLKQASADEVFHRAGPPRQQFRQQAQQRNEPEDYPDPFDRGDHVEPVTQPPRSVPRPGVSTKASQAQVKLISMKTKAKGMTDAEAVAAYCSSVIGRKITNATDLTKSEASKVIDRLVTE